MNLAITQSILIEEARVKSGLGFGDMVKELGVHHNRITDLRKGKAAINTDEIAYFADKAGLPIIDTVMALRPQFAHVWQHAKDAWQRT